MADGDGDAQLGVEGRSYLPSPAAHSSSSTLSLSPPPDELPEDWNDRVEIERRASDIEMCEADSDGPSDDSSATLSDEESSQHLDGGRKARREYLNIQLWTPGGDRDPWEFRSGTQDKHTELTTASKLLYDKVEGGRPPRAIINEPTSLASLRHCQKGILYDNHGKKIRPRLPKYLERVVKENSQFVMPESIPTTRDSTAEATEAEMEDDGWNGYYNLDGSEMDVIQAINDFSFAVKRARHRARSQPPPRVRSESPPSSQPSPPPPPAQAPVFRPSQKRHQTKNHQHRQRCSHGDLRRPHPPHHHITAHMRTGPAPNNQPLPAQYTPLPIRSAPAPVNGFIPSIQVTPASEASESPVAQRTLRSIAPRSQVAPNVYLFPVQPYLKPIPVPQYLNRVVPPSQSTFSSPYSAPYVSPYASASSVPATESFLRESYVRREVPRQTLISHDNMYRSARKMPYPDSHHSYHGGGLAKQPSRKNLKVTFADEYTEDETTDNDSEE